MCEIIVDYDFCRAKCACLMFQTLERQSNSRRPHSKAIERYFTQFGTIMAFNQSRNNGYVVFENISQAQRVLDAPQPFVNGCKIKLIPAVRDLSAR